jgi:hypothetical protein
MFPLWRRGYDVCADEFVTGWWWVSISCMTERLDMRAVDHWQWRVVIGVALVLPARGHREPFAA